VSSWIERPKPANKQNEDKRYADGVRAGEQWATTDAEYDELERVSDLAQFFHDDFHGALSALCNAVEPLSDGNSPYIVEELFGDQRDVSDTEAAGFISGAGQYFKSLEDQI
jgi:hypothetical protein